jgi:hypothetical protein
MKYCIYKYHNTYDPMAHIRVALWGWLTSCNDFYIVYEPSGICHKCGKKYKKVDSD